MKKLLRFVVLLILLCESSSNQGRTSSDFFLESYRTLRHLIMNFNLLSKQKNSDRLGKDSDKVQNYIPASVPFPCDVKNVRSSIRPQSVHQIKPGDVDVVAAMGDSLTVALGSTATNILEVLIEERGTSFSIGGQGNWRTYTTLPNILKVFNPNLIGYSLKDSLSIQAESQLNVAEVSAISEDMPYMTKELIKRVKSDRRVNVTEDWKMITLFIGANDFCAHSCYLNDPMLSLEKHRNDVIEVLRLIRNHLPRTIVNIIPPPNLRILVELKALNPSCDIWRRVECPCLFGIPFAGKRNLMFRLMTQWQQVDIEVASLAEFDMDDFTVVLQPYSLNYTFPQHSHVVDDRYLSADCFHWSQKMQARVANDLWNTLMEPVGKKSFDGNEFLKKFNCPTEENPFIFTRRNSKNSST